MAVQAAGLVHASLSAMPHSAQPPSMRAWRWGGADSCNSSSGNIAIMTYTAANSSTDKTPQQGSSATGSGGSGGSAAQAISTSAWAAGRSYAASLDACERMQQRMQRAHAAQGANASRGSASNKQGGPAFAQGPVSSAILSVDSAPPAQRVEASSHHHVLAAAHSFGSAGSMRPGHVYDDEEDSDEDGSDLPLLEPPQYSFASFCARMPLEAGMRLLLPPAHASTPASAHAAGADSTGSSTAALAAGGVPEAAGSQAAAGAAAGLVAYGYLASDVEAELMTGACAGKYDTVSSAALMQPAIDWAHDISTAQRRHLDAGLFSILGLLVKAFNSRVPKPQNDFVNQTVEDSVFLALDCNAHGVDVAVAGVPEPTRVVS